MAAVPQKTLNWLYSVLNGVYRDPSRTYSDLAQTLSRYPSLSPRTDVYTFENGKSALLAHFVGTIPVSFRAATYRFPIALWIPHGYPYEPPMVYVTPSDDMLVRPGQHVAGDGRVYHHYLAHWRDAWDRSNVVDFLSILVDIFAKEPPVMSKQQITGNQSRQVAMPTPPPLPPIPPDLHRQKNPSQNSNPAASSPGPPVPPPKQASQTESIPMEARRPGRYEVPPPLPGQPPRPDDTQGNVSFHQNGEMRRPISGLQHAPQRATSLRQQAGQNALGGAGVGHGQPWNPQQQMPPQQPFGSTNPGNMVPQQQQPINQIQPGFSNPPQTSQRYPQPLPQFQPPFPLNLQRQQPPPQHLATKPPPMDLLDSPFDVSLPVAQNLPAPPVPRNPEKDAILSAISTALTQTLHSSISQNNAALPSLQAQHVALSSTYQQLEAELANINLLNATLSSNVTILQESLQRSDRAIVTSKERAKRGDVPKVDEMVTAHNIVGNQLYDVVCEERGIEAGIRALQEGLVRGRIGSELWAKKTRELAREGFRKRILARKIGSGMGLSGV